MKIFFIITLLVIQTLFGAPHNEGKKYVEIIPANINYANENAEAFAELLYDAFQNGVATYNYKQSAKEAIYYIKENTLPELKYQKRVKRFHKEIKKDPLGYISRRDLSKLIVMDFSTKKVARMMDRCQSSCLVKLKVLWYESDGSVKTEILPLYYDGRYAILTEQSEQLINKKIEKFLEK